MKQLKAIILDGDGVLFDSMARNAEAYCEVLSGVGLAIDPAEVYAHEGRGSRDLMAHLARAHERSLSHTELDALAEQHRSLFMGYGREPSRTGLTEVGTAPLLPRT